MLHYEQKNSNMMCLGAMSMCMCTQMNMACLAALHVGNERMYSGYTSSKGMC
ncbi:MAG: hypothetical protein ACI4EF_00415 [Coprococcus sp.]